MEKETWDQFENRKVDHIQLALSDAMQTSGLSGLDRVQLTHRAFPEINWQDVDISTGLFGGEVAERFPNFRNLKVASPLFVSSMTAGHQGANDINLCLARVCQKRNWPLAVGSQRRQLGDPFASREWKALRAESPKAILIGNLGIAQAIESSTSDVVRLAESLEASAMIIHTNPLQEVVQPEGTPQFAGGIAAISRLAKALEIPLIVKEVGCGMSRADFEALMDSGVSVVDVSGLGGTHWGRIEGARSKSDSDWRAEASRTFAEWGIPTVESLLAGLEMNPKYDLWASGGVRSGLDAAKLVAIGARMVGIAKPALAAALAGEEKLNLLFERFEQEFRMSLFCTGHKTVETFQRNRVWSHKKI